MLDLKSRETLADWFDYALRFEQEPRRVRAECVAAIKANPALLIELLALDDAAIWERFTAAARRHGAGMRTVTGDTRPAAVAPARSVVSSYVAARPGPGKKQLPPIPRETERRIMNETARVMIMIIDGMDLRQWTLGRVKTRARTAGHEARVLERIAREYQNGLFDDRTIGELIADEALLKLIAECK